VVNHKDVVLAVLAASAALAALVLFYLGLLGTIIQGYDVTANPSAKRPVKVTGGITFAAFLVSLLATGLSMWWLLGPQSAKLYVLLNLAFLIVLVLLAVAAAWTFFTQIMRG
jgi:hypothetical protein